MTEAQQSSFATKGFSVISEYLARPQTESLLAGIEAKGALAGGVRRKRGVEFARRNLLSLDIVREFIRTAPVMRLIDRLAPGAVAVRAVLFDKTGRANWTVPWHQDRSVAVAERIDVPGFGPWSRKAGVVHVEPPLSVLEQMVALRFSLDACEVDNGPLRLIAGTHRRIMSSSEIESTVRDEPQTHCTTGVGGVVIMRPLILHASSPARVARHRRVLHLEFGPAMLPGGLRWAFASPAKVESVT